MTKTFLFLVCGGLLLLLALSTAGCTDKSYGYASSGSTISVTPGETIQVSLGEKPSTGFMWYGNVTGDMAIAKREVSSTSWGGMPGSDSATVTFTLTAGRDPVQKFMARKDRPNGNESHIIDTFELTFVPAGH